MTVAELEALLGVQELDTVLDQLRHRREALPERAELVAAVTARQAAEAALATLVEERAGVLAEERKLDDEAQSLTDKMAEVDRTLYSGTVTSPRELQALQADLESLRRHRSELEDQELEVMERREGLDAAVADAEGTVAPIVERIAVLQAAIADAERGIDAEITTTTTARAERATAVAPELLADYERRRAANRGIGIARLAGGMCQGCRLSIPATEVDEIRRNPEAQRYTCDNCGAILVPGA